MDTLPEIIGLLGVIGILLVINIVLLCYASGLMDSINLFQGEDGGVG